MKELFLVGLDEVLFIPFEEVAFVQLIVGAKLLELMITDADVLVVPFPKPS